MLGLDITQTLHKHPLHECSKRVEHCGCLGSQIELYVPSPSKDTLVIQKAWDLGTGE